MMSSLTQILLLQEIEKTIKSLQHHLYVVH